MESTRRKLVSQSVLTSIIRPPADFMEKQPMSKLELFPGQVPKESRFHSAILPMRMVDYVNLR